MRTVNMHEAKTHLSKLVEGAVQGEPFIIARAGKPLVKVVAVEGAAHAPKRIGFMEGAPYSVPDDFDTMFAEEIRAMFEDGPIWPEGHDQNGPLPSAPEEKRDRDA